MVFSIVFVHGLTGSWKTWYEPRTKTFWPSDLLPKDVPSARIFVWEYDADVFKKWINHHPSTNKLFAHGSNLCGRLAGRRQISGTVSLPQGINHLSISSRLRSGSNIGRSFSFAIRWAGW